MLNSGDKILFVSQYAGFIGGLERYIHASATLLKRAGFRVYGLFGEKVNESEKFLSVFDRHWPLSELAQVRPDFDLATVHKIVDPICLEKLIEKFSPTIFVHDHDYYCPKGYKYFLYRRKNCGLPYARLRCGACASLVPPRQIPGGYGALLRRNFLQAPRRFASFRKAPAFVVLSEFMKRCLVSNGVGQERIHVLHPFIDLPEMAAQSDVQEIPSLVFIGQQVMSKGTPLFLEAMRQVRTPCRAYVVGSGPRLEDFRALSVEMGLADRVVFTGWSSEPQAYLKKAALAVFPSLWQEPFGLSGIEAMSLGLPVVGFRVGGVSEWLRDGFNGILVPERDTAAMAQAIDRLFSDVALRKKLGEQGRAYIASAYSTEKYLTDFAQLA